MKPNEEQFKLLLTQARAGNNKAINDFIEMNKPIAIYAINIIHSNGKYINYTNDELLSLGLIAIHKSIKTYNDVDNYNTYLIWMVKSEVKNHNTTYGSVVKQPRKEDKIKYTDEFNNEAYEDDNTFQNKDHLTHIRSILNKNLDKLSINERNVLKSLYFDELTNRETARLLDISDGAVSNLHRVGIKKLKKLML
jgi:RNA polymerase sigma factor (sigma-70 family)